MRLGEDNGKESMRTVRETRRRELHMGSEKIIKLSGQVIRFMKRNARVGRMQSRNVITLK